MISINLRKGDDSASDAMNHFDPTHTLVLPTRNLVLFPGVALPIQLGRESSISVADFAKTAQLPIAVFCQRDASVDVPGLKDLYTTGTLARVIDIIELPDGIKTAIVEGLVKVELTGISNKETLPSVMAVSVNVVKEKGLPKSKSMRFDVTVDKIRGIAKTMGEHSFDKSMEIHLPQIDKTPNPVDLINSLCVYLPLTVDDKQSLLQTQHIEQRADMLLEFMMRFDAQNNIMKDIMERTRARMEEGQRNAFLQQQMEVLRQEIEGDDEDELDELAAAAESALMPEDVKQRFDKELKKLRRYNPQSPDYAVQYTYLDTLVNVPWSVFSESNNTFKDAEQILERDHFGLRKIKDRILEQIAVITNNPANQAPIICFVGPPGVGKTSLGQSIAEALGREFQRVSLGGMHDESEIRGHRRTYIGSMPGRIVEAMRRAGTINPLIMLDELDKIGADFKGDPAAALLEVLDPAQNCRFHDNYLDVDYDLSNVMFIATANTLSTISKPLLDRIEVIELAGYTREEKVEIAMRHLIPRLRNKNNIGTDVFTIKRPAVAKLIENYTSESGVRQLEKRLEMLMRKKLLQKMRELPDFNPKVDARDLPTLLGPAVYHHDNIERNNIPGVVNGLAWTAVGGELLLAESALSPGKGVLSITGNLGDVMKESATLALEWIKVNAEKLCIDSEIFKTNDVHLHFPEGAIPKDGPSAGITIATAITSALTGKPVSPLIAMTGEITLRGKVLPVGGIKEKILAAKRAGVTTIILSEDNRADVEEIESEYRDGLEFKYVRDALQVIDYALSETKLPTQAKKKSSKR